VIELFATYWTNFRRGFGMCGAPFMLCSCRNRGKSLGAALPALEGFSIHICKL